jgi:hypothetical protein
MILLPLAYIYFRPASLQLAYHALGGFIGLSMFSIVHAGGLVCHARAFHEHELNLATTHANALDHSDEGSTARLSQTVPALSLVELCRDSTSADLTMVITLSASVCLAVLTSAAASGSWFTLPIVSLDQIPIRLISLLLVSVVFILLLDAFEVLPCQESTLVRPSATLTQDRLSDSTISASHSSQPPMEFSSLQQTESSSQINALSVNIPPPSPDSFSLFPPSHFGLAHLPTTVLPAEHNSLVQHQSDIELHSIMHEDSVVLPETPSHALRPRPSLASPMSEAGMEFPLQASDESSVSISEMVYAVVKHRATMAVLTGMVACFSLRSCVIASTVLPISPVHNATGSIPASSESLSAFTIDPFSYVIFSHLIAVLLLVPYLIHSADQRTELWRSWRQHKTLLLAVVTPASLLISVCNALSVWYLQRLSFDFLTASQPDSSAAGISKLVSIISAQTLILICVACALGYTLLSEQWLFQGPSCCPEHDGQAIGFASLCCMISRVFNFRLCCVSVLAAVAAWVWVIS